MERPRLEGIIAATVLPVRPDFTLDEAALRAYLEWLLAEGVHGLADVIFAPPVRNYRARLKEALRALGVIPYAAIRPPLPALAGEERERVGQALREAGSSSRKF